MLFLEWVRGSGGVAGDVRRMKKIACPTLKRLDSAHTGTILPRPRRPHTRGGDAAWAQQWWVLLLYRVPCTASRRVAARLKKAKK